MKKSNVFNLKIGTIVLAAWLVFSVAYIVMDLWKGGLNLANRIGYERAYVEIITKSQAACEPFSIFAGEAKIDLINMVCLKPAPKTEQAEAENQALEEKEAK